jgi:hypothetical protein
MKSERRKSQQITMRFAPPRASRAPGYTAPKACRRVTELMESGGAWPMTVRAWRRVGTL